MNLGYLVSQHLPKTLYHGSGFEQTELKPGYKHTKKLVTWDNTESNAYLYATIYKEAAELLGISSSLEKKFELHRTQINEESKTVNLIFYNDIPDKEELFKVPVYLYTIPFTDAWRKNTNKVNNIEGEYKTVETITNISSIEQVDVRKLLADFTINMRRL